MSNSTITNLLVGGSGYVSTYAAWNATTGTPVLEYSANVSSLTDNGTGDVTVNFTTSYAANDYAALQCSGNAANTVTCQIRTRSAGSCRVLTLNASIASPLDIDNNGFMAAGDF